jgi:hypothetical protein
MTALTSDAQRIEKEGRVQAMPVAAAVKIFKNAILMRNVAGYVLPAASLADAVFAGVAYEAADNTSGDNGDIKLRVETERAFEFDGAGFTQADLLKEVYAADDNTVQIAAGTNLVKVGKIIEVISATKVLVKLAV